MSKKKAAAAPKQTVEERIEALAIALERQTARVGLLSDAVRELSDRVNEPVTKKERWFW